MVIIIICWPGNLLIKKIIEGLFPNLFGGNDFEKRDEYFGILVNVGVSANYYVYFIFR